MPDAIQLVRPDGTLGPADYSGGPIYGDTPVQQDGFLGTVRDEAIQAVANPVGGIFALGGALGDRLGVQNNADDLIANYLQQASDDASARSALTQNIGDVNSVGSALGFGVHALVSAAPTAAAIGAADYLTGGAAVPLDGVIGGTALRTFGKGAIDRGAARLVAAGVPAEVAQAQATDAVAQAIGSGAVRVGAGALATAPSTIGNLLQNQQAAGGKTDLLSAVALGIPDALLNTVGPGGALVDGIGRVAGGGALQRIGGTILGNAAKQGVVSVAQTGIEQASDATVGANPYQNSDGFDQLAQAFAAGGLVGGGLGIAGAAGIHPQEQLGQSQIDPLVQQAQARQQAEAQAAQAAANAPKPLLALPAPASPPPILVDSQGRAQVPGSGSTIVGDNYANQQSALAAAQVAAAHQAGIPTVSGPPGTQGDLLPNAPRMAPPPTATPPSITAPQGDLFPGAPAQTPPPAGQLALPLGRQAGPAPATPALPTPNDLFPAAPEARGGPNSEPVVQGLGLLPKNQAQAIDASLPTTGSILSKLQSAAVPSGGKLLPSTSGLVNLAASLSSHLMNGDIAAAQKVVDDHLQTIQNNRNLSAKGIQQNAAALDAAQQIVNQANDKISAQQARIHAGERDEAQGLASMVQGKTSTDILRQAIDAHSTGGASLEDVRNVTAALMARKYGAARKLVANLQDKPDGPTAVSPQEIAAAQAPARPGPNEPANPQNQTAQGGGEIGRPAPQATAGRGPAEVARPPVGRLDPQGTVPETQATLRAQQKQLVRGNRPAMMYPLDERGAPTRELPLPAGMARHVTPDGTFHYNPKRTSPDAINQAIASDKIGSLLGLGPYSKAAITARINAGEKPAAVVERTPDGTEVRGAAGTEKTAPEQVRQMKAAADKGNTVSVEDPARVIAQRRSKLSPLQERLNRALADGTIDPEEHAGQSKLLLKDPAHPAVKVALDAHDLTSRIADAEDAGKITSAESDKLQDMVEKGRMKPGLHDEVRDRLSQVENPGVKDALNAALDRAKTKADPRSKQLQEIADEGHRTGQLETADHEEVTNLLREGGDDNVSQAQAIMAAAQRNAMRKRTADAPAAGMSREAVDRVVAEHGFNGQGPRVNVVQHAADLPDHLREAGQNAKGIYENGTVHLVADNHSTPTDARATLFHEALGHYGLAKMFGSKLDEVMGDIYKTNPTIRRAADAWMSENPGMYRDSPHLQARAAEEALAQLQEHGPDKPFPLQAALRRVMGVIRDVGRRMGLVKNFSDGDVVRILQAATKAARSAPDDMPPDSAPRLRSTDNKYADLARDKGEVAVKGSIERVNAALIHTLTMRQIRDVYGSMRPVVKTIVDLMARKQTEISDHAQRAILPLDAYSRLSADEKVATSKLMIKSRETQDLASKPGSALAKDYAALSPQGRAVYDQHLAYYQAERQHLIDAFKAVATSLAKDAPGASEYINRVVKAFGRMEVYVPYVRDGSHIVVAEHANGDREVRAFSGLGEARVYAEKAQDAGYRTTPFTSDSYSMQGHAGFEDFADKLGNAIEDNAKVLEKAGDVDGAKLLRGQLDEIRQVMLTMLPEGSIMKKTATAKGVAGFEEDMGKAMNLSAKRNARMIANLKMGTQARAALAELRGLSRAGSNTNFRADQVYRQVLENYQSSLSAGHTPIQNFINNVGYVYQLSGSVAFTFMHFMQTPLVTTQMLAAYHGQVGATGALLRAMKEISSDYFSKDVAGDIKSRLAKNGAAHADIARFGKTAGERQMLSYLDAQGHFSGTDARQRLDELVGAGGLTKAGRDAMTIGSYMPHHTERYNRIITALAAYRLNEASGKIGPNMEEYQRTRDTFKDDPNVQAMTPGQYASTMHAEDMVTQSHTDYNQANTSGLFSKPGGFLPKKIMFQFKKYQQNMMFTMVHNAVQAFKAHDPDTRSVARRTFLGLMATHFLAAGIMGMPMYGAATGLMDIYNQFVGDHDNPFDADASFREMMTDEFGAPMAQALDSGILFSLPGIKNILPADVTNRIGLGDLFSPGNPTGEINSDNFLQYVGGQILGSTGALMGQAADAYNDTRDGNTWRALEDVMPKALRDIAKASRFATYGVRTASGEIEVPQDELTGGDIFAQALGFQPQKVERAEAAREYLYTEQQQLEDRQTALTQQYLRAVTEGGDVSAVMNAINDYNGQRYAENQGNHAITADALQKSVKEFYENAALERGGVALKGQDLEGFGGITEFSRGLDQQPQ